MDTKDAELVLHAKGLTKHFGQVKALDGLDLSVKRGEVHGFLGPNGAGKSTTIRVLLGLQRKTAGEARVLDGDPWHDAVQLHRRLAYIPGEVNLWPSLSGGEAIDVLLKLRGSNIDTKQRDDLIDRFGLDPRKKIREYSKGNRQKVAIVAALAAQAELYLMDEPTAGLDPLMEATFQECVHELSRHGKTVLLSSHILAEVEALCDRVSIIREGKIVESGSLAQLRHLTRVSVKVTTDKPLDSLKMMTTGVYNLAIDGTTATFEADRHALSSVLARLSELGVQDIISHPPTLEELFLRHYAGETPAEEEGITKEQ